MLKVARKKMACCLSLFRKKKKTKRTPDECNPQQLVDLEKRLEKQAEDIEKQIEECVETAKANRVTRKRVALRALQKKSQLERKLQLLDHTLTTLEQQRDAIENAEINKAVLESIKSASKVLKKPKVKLDFEKVTTIMEEIKDQHETESEITEAIRKSFVMKLDEEDLEKELNELIQSDSFETSIESQLEKLPSIPKDLDEVFNLPEENNQKKLTVNTRDILNK